ncbi:MAG: LysR family transcriptional regulator [Propionibacteriales bacterium]|nr:LysR family transcriptional regulator [Propionibacteriales bacterium]
MLDVTRLRVLAAVARHGSVTKAAQVLHYAQPSVSHHLARLEAETGARLFQRVGRGIRLTEAGRVLAERAEEVLGRLDAAENELAAISGLAAGRVRLAAFPSAFATVVPDSVARFGASYPGLDLRLVEAEPPSALRMLRAGEVDVAMVFTHEPDRISETDGLHTTALFDEPLFLVLPPGSRRRRARLADHADDAWIAGCERCREHLLEQCANAGFAPQVAFSTDDYVAVQSLVAAGVGVSTLPGLALAAHRHPDVVLSRLPGEVRHVLAATYGDPPDPPAVTALVECLAAAAESAGDRSP